MYIKWKKAFRQKESAFKKLWELLENYPFQITFNHTNVSVPFAQWSHLFSKIFKYKEAVRCFKNSLHRGKKVNWFYCGKGEKMSDAVSESLAARPGCACGGLCTPTPAIGLPLQPPGREELLCCSKGLLQGTGAAWHFTGDTPDTKQGHRRHALHQRLHYFQEMSKYSTDQYDALAAATTIFCLYNILIQIAQYFVYVNVFVNIEVFFLTGISANILKC